MDKHILNPERGGYDLPERTKFSNRAEVVKRALAGIPESQSEVLEIAYYQGMIKVKDILEEYVSPK